MPVNANDPRVKRTRELLLKSFMELVEEKKNVYSISVQDIATRATVNRATFYAHFEDKYAFLECWMREKFQWAVEERMQESSISDITGLRTLILTVFDFLAMFRQYITPPDKQFEPLFEIAIQKELYQILLNWLKEASDTDVSTEIVEATALVISWGILGSAVQWSRRAQKRSAEAMVGDVLVVVAAGLVPVIG